MRLRYWKRELALGGHKVTPEQAQKVVLTGNIGKVSCQSRQLGNGLSLPTRRMAEDDLRTAFSGRREIGKCPLRAGPGLILRPYAARARQYNCEGND